MRIWDGDDSNGGDSGGTAGDGVLAATDDYSDILIHF